MFRLAALAAISMMPYLGYSQAPVLGASANFALFSKDGAVKNTGLSLLTGDVGSNNGSVTNFGNVDGVMHNADGATATAAADLTIAYNQLNAAIPTQFPASLLGNGQVLTAGIYSVAGGATLSNSLTLNGQGNASAVFIFQVQGAMSSTVASSILLTNGAQACNVYWKVEGAVSFATDTDFKGTLVANNAAIVLGQGTTIEGRALSTTGAITVTGVKVTTPLGCGRAVLTGPPAPPLASVACYTLFSGNGSVTNTGISFITGDVGTNVGLTTGYQATNVTGTIHPNPDVSTAQCAADLGVVYTFLNTLPNDIELLYPAQFGNDLVLTPHTYLLNGATVLTGEVSLDAQNNPNAVFVLKIVGAFSTSTFASVALLNGAQAKNVFWKVDGAVNLNDFTNFKGTIVANNGAVTLRTGVTIAGRAFTTNGAFSTFAINAGMTPGCTPTFTFTGTGSWTSTANWSSGMVPTATDSATIASSAVATSSAGFDVKSLTVQANASLTIQSSSGIINVKNMLHNAGTITFPTKGTAGITIGGGTLNPAIISGNLIRLRSIKALSNLKVDADLEIGATFDLNGKSVNLSSKRVTLKSNSISTAQLLQPTGSALANASNFTVERYMAPSLASGGGAWVLVGAQTQGQTVNLWSANNPYAAASYNQTTPTGSSIATFDPFYIGAGAGGYKKPTGPTQAALVGIGHRVWFRTTEFFTGAAGLWKSAGAPKIGDHTFPLQFCSGANCAITGTTTQNGWNLIANPYAATIDWDANGAWTKTSVYNATYIYRHKFSNNATYINGVGVNGGSKLIPSGQGFMVWANNANAVLSVNEQAIDIFGNPAIQRQGALADVIKLNIGGVTNPNLQDQIALRWDATATAGFDQTLEANKMVSATGVNLSFLNGTTPMAILAEALLTVTTSYPLALTAPSSGTYTISFEGLASLSNPQWSLYLLDNQTGINTLVTETASYSFSASQGANNGRFSLVIYPAGVTNLRAAISNKVLLSPNPATSVVTLQLAQAISQATTFRITNAVGQVVNTATMPANSTELSLDLSNLAKGVYMVQAPGFGVTKLMKE